MPMIEWVPMTKRGNNSTTLVVLIAVNILNFYDRNVIGALTEPIREEFGLTDGQVGLMGSAAPLSAVL